MNFHNTFQSLIMLRSLILSASAGKGPTQEKKNIQVTRKVERQIEGPRWFISNKPD